MRTKKKRTYKKRLFKARRAYSYEEIAELVGVHVRTVQVWKKEGLKIIDDATKPYLAMGQDIRDFLETKQQKRKKPLNVGEFFCPRCQGPVRSRTSALKVEVTQKMLGKSHRQVLLRGVCAVCDQALTLFSSDRKAKEWTSKGLIPAEAVNILTGIENSSVNTDISKGQYNG